VPGLADNSLFPSISRFFTHPTDSTIILVMQFSGGLSNKVSNIIRRPMDNMKLLLIQSPAEKPDDF
jgi:hypothetical protein